MGSPKFPVRWSGRVNRRSGDRRLLFSIRRCRNRRQVSGHGPAPQPSGQRGQMGGKGHQPSRQRINRPPIRSETPNDNKWEGRDVASLLLSPRSGTERKREVAEAGDVRERGSPLVSSSSRSTMLETVRA
ncbi:hypothetical protein BHE74_00011422 [Ensete ventricosum]|nr:hypothetical protein BHE74_00011422 [Ensete ventricosum]